MADAFYLKRNDTKEPIEATLSDQAGPVDLTGATVKFHMRSMSGTVKVGAPATVVDAPNGVVRYAWAAADVDEAGKFLAEWEVTFADEKVQTFPNDGYTAVVITEDIA
jgi:hypothetical protein